MSALQGPLLTLSKVLVDSLDSAQLRASLATPPDKQTASLGLLQLYLAQRGGQPETVQPLKDLQRLRSKGGFAHYVGGAVNLELDAIAPGLRTAAEVFGHLCRNLINALNVVTETISTFAKHSRRS
ncbi:hypothetical protein L3Q67_02620 [Saccharothrix sp. AJ9571]|nr:hypothetical protein L3Q67_02620 [Saccharothrix sp. AJ9571]